MKRGRGCGDASTGSSRRKQVCNPSRGGGEGSAQLALPTEQKHKNISAVNYLDEVKETFKDNLEKCYEFKNVMKDFKGERSEQVALLAEQKHKTKSEVYLDEVKETFKDNVEKCYEFKKVMKDFKGKRISISEMSEKIKDLFKGQPKLILGFNKFLPKEHEINLPFEEDNPHLLVRKPDREKEHDQSGLKRSTIRHPCKKQKSDDSLKGSNKPVVELCISNDEECTPSYRRLPNNHVFPLVSYRDKLATSVLNDQLVSVTLRKEENSFKHFRKNPYEQILFRVEEDRFELDMLLESYKSTIKIVEELLEKLGTKNEEILTLVEEHLTARHLRCIQQLDNDPRLNEMDKMKNDVHTSLVVLLSRLKQKQTKWVKAKPNFEKVWADLQENFDEKSRDHQSFNINQKADNKLSQEGGYQTEKAACHRPSKEQS